jgi:hypothetical protein
MNPDDPIIHNILKRAMVARIASLSRHGRPSVNPLYFIYLDHKIWLGTAEWTLAARNAAVDPRVSLLFNIERQPGINYAVRINGRARVNKDIRIVRRYGVHAATKYILTPSGIYNWLSHPHQLWLRHYYVAQSHQKGRACVIEVTPKTIELLSMA